MLRDTEKRTAPRTWSSASTAILAAFVVIGTLQAGSHHVAGAILCFALAVAYPPLRVLRGRLTASRNHR